jgi:beta-phosphoglucomutase-like phosphatase (HAD superfamily)
MKKYLIFDLDGTLVQSAQQIDKIIYNYIQENLDPELMEHARYLIKNNQGMSLYE